jgi:hypothetical protein
MLRKRHYDSQRSLNSQAEAMLQGSCCIQIA